MTKQERARKNKDFRDVTAECHRLVLHYLIKIEGMTHTEAVAHIEEVGHKPLLIKAA